MPLRAHFGSVADLHAATLMEGGMKYWIGTCLAAVATLFAGTALATYHLFAVEQIYSNADGSVQFIVLHETDGLNGENLLKGKTLKVTHAGVTKSFTFPNNLPGGECGY